MLKKELKERREIALTLFRKCEEGKPCNIPLSAYFKRFSKKGFKSKVRVGKHKIHQFYKEDGSARLYGTIYRDIYVDATYNLALLKGEKPICSIGFKARRTTIPTILVKQIQGVKNRGGELYPFRWEKMLLQILIDWAKQNGFERIDVIRAKHSTWHSKYNEERNERMYMKYDVTAKRMGFKFDESRRVYSLYL